MKRGLIDKRMIRHIDWLLLAIVTAIVLFGVVALASTTSSVSSEGANSFSEILSSIQVEFPGLQMVFYVVGLIAVVVILMMDYNNLRDFCEAIYWVSVLLLAAVWLFGTSRNGTTGWFIIGNRGFQPAEICKISIIIVLAKKLADVTEGQEEGLTKFSQIWPVLWRFAIPFVLIMLQPDWGTAFVYLFVLVGLLFVAKLSWKMILVFVTASAAAVPLLWTIMVPYQKNRILTFLDPELDPTGAGLNAGRAKIVAGSGGFSGKGLFSADLLTQRSKYLPEEHTDFLFAGSMEAVGFIGGLILIVLYMALILRVIQVGLRARDDFGCYLAFGVAFMLFFHIFENIGMNIGLMPITGIPLPLFSYGGSNMLTTMVAIGLVLNVNMRRQRWSP